jgi:polyadenylation factor subunit 2
VCTQVNHRFVSGGEDKAVRIWDWGQAREERSLEGHGHRVNSLDWHPSFALLASASKDNTVRFSFRST